MDWKFLDRTKARAGGAVVGALLALGAGMVGCGGGPPPVSCSLIGTWKGVASDGVEYLAMFAPDGTYTGTTNGQPGTGGTWTLVGSTFTFTDSGECGSGMASYTATFDASCKSVTLSMGVDEC